MKVKHLLVVQGYLLSTLIQFKVHYDTLQLEYQIDFRDAFRTL